MKAIPKYKTKKEETQAKRKILLDYMRTRVGLKPKEYDKKDIELE